MHPTSRMFCVPSIEIIQPGALTTVQDLGRNGCGRWGICRSGALDPWALRLANLLVGNPESAGGLEITGPGARLRFVGRAVICLVGADLGFQLDGEPLAPGQPRIAHDRQFLSFTARRRGFRAFLAVRGGIQSRVHFGSRATDMATHWPRGRLQASEMLEVEASHEPPQLPQIPPETEDALGALLQDLGASPDSTATLGFLPAVSNAATWLQTQSFRVSARSNRTGFRLDPTVACPMPATRTAWSEPVSPGTIQLPPDGHPILLLADAPTLGGYPVLGHLASVDHSRAAQLAPGDEVRFRSVTLPQAHAMARHREDLMGLVARSFSRPQAPELRPQSS